MTYIFLSKDQKCTIPIEASSKMEAWEKLKVYLAKKKILTSAWKLLGSQG